MTPDPQATVRRALACAARGWPVFPCKAGTKEPATRHGFRDATTDPARIAAWWHRMPDANLAIATGAPGPDVLDVDQRGSSGNGFAALNQLARADIFGRPSAIVATPSGGLHAYYLGTAQPSGRLPRHHLDFKAAGGYVLAPPSVVGGKPYRLLREQTGTATLDWQAAAALLEPQPVRPARQDRAGTRDVSHLAAWVERLQPGNRNAGLFWAACRAIEADDPGALDDLTAAALRTGLTSREINRTIASAQRGRSCPAGRQPEPEGGR